MLSEGGMLFLVAVLIVNADEGTAEGQYLAEGDEYAVMNLTQRRYHKSRYQ